MPRIRSCGISTLDGAVSVRAVVVRGYEALICVLPFRSIRFLDARERSRKAHRRKAWIELRRFDDFDSYSGRRRLRRACATFGT